MTGQLPSRIGAYDNAAEFPSSIPTVGHYLRDMGYHTCLCGKMHFIGPDQLHGFEERLTTDIYPADFGWTPDWKRPEHRPSWYHNMLSIVQAGTCQASNQLDFDEEVSFHALRKIYKLARNKAEVMARWDPESIKQDVLASQRRRRLVARALVTGQSTPWDFQPCRDASQQYMRNTSELDDLERRARFPPPEVPLPDLLPGSQP